MNETEYDDAANLFLRAPHCARVGNWTQASAVVRELDDRYDGEGVKILLIELADTMILCRGGLPRPDQVMVPVVEDTVGRSFDVNDVRPEVRWAGRFVAARAAGDETTCAALVNSCTTNDEFTLHVAALLQVAAATLNTVGAP